MKETYLIIRYEKTDGIWYEAEFKAVALLYAADAAHINRKFDETGIRAAKLCNDVMLKK